MIPFKFKLQPELDQRARVVRDCQQRVSALQYQRIQLEERVRRFQCQIREERHILREQLTGGADIPKARLQAHATVFLTHKADDLVREIAGVYTQLESARRQLSAASSQKRALERLREKRQKEWVKEKQKREQNELEDITSMRTARG